MKTQAFGLCQGYVSLDCKDRKGNGVIRADQYDLDPVKLYMLGNIEPATLTIEYDEDSDLAGKVCLEGSPSCLLDESSGDLKEWAHSDKQKLKLINNTETTVSFEIFHPEYVSIYIRERKGSSTEWVLITDQHLSLPPRKHFELKVSLYLTKLLVDDLIKDVAKDDKSFSVDKQPSGQ